VRLVFVDGLSQREAARRLSLSVKTLGGWIVAERKGTLGKIGKMQKSQTEVEAELARVKRELATVTMERDILKNIRRGAPLPKGQKLRAKVYTGNAEGSGRPLIGD
jgi:transposase